MPSNVLNNIKWQLEAIISQHMHLEAWLHWIVMAVGYTHHENQAGAYSVHIIIISRHWAAMH